VRLDTVRRSPLKTAGNRSIRTSTGAQLVRTRAVGTPAYPPSLVERLTVEEQRVLWEQFVDVYAHSQDSFDTSVRAIAAGGLGVTVALGTALKDGLTATGKAAACVFLVGLGANLISYGTAQRDMRTRLDAVAAADRAGALGNRWTAATHVLNFVAGAALVAGGGLLAYFVATAA
jgi:hypothetical protein